MHFDTGLLWVDVEDDFNRARRRQMLARLAGWLRGQPGHASRILSLDEVVAALGWRSEHYLGLRTIQLDTVAGTVDSRRDFDRKFRPPLTGCGSDGSGWISRSGAACPFRRSTCTASGTCISSWTATTASRSL